MRAGDHLGMVYCDLEEKMSAVSLFVKEGLAKGACCVYVADESTVEEISDALYSSDVDVAERRQQGNLCFLTKWEYRRQAELELEVMSDVINGLVSEASAGGWAGLWLAVEMTWTLASEVDQKQLLKWEATLDSVLEGKPAVVFCLYNQNKMAPAVLNSALRTHPFLMGKGMVCQNPYYDPPELILGSEDALKQKVDWMLGQVQRLQAQQQVLAESEKLYQIRAAENARGAVGWMRGDQEGDLFYQQILDLEERLSRLQQAPPQEQDQLLKPTLGELRTSLQQLHITREELLNQSRELEATRYALEEARQRYQELFELAPDGYLVTDLAGTIREANQVLGSQLDLSPDLLLGKPILALVVPEDRRDFGFHLHRLSRNQQNSEFETRLEPSEGEVFSVRFTVKPARDLEGQVTGLRWLVRHANEQEKAAEELARQGDELARLQEPFRVLVTGAKGNDLFLLDPSGSIYIRSLDAQHISGDQVKEVLRSQEQFRLLVTGIKDYAIFLLDPSGNISTWNLGAQQVKGYKAEEIIGQHFSRFYTEEAIQEGKPQHLLKVAAAEGRVEDQGWRVRKDGSRFWANVIITALRDQDGELLGFAKVTRDLTDQMKAEEERIWLRELASKEEERRRVQVLINACPVGVIVVDASTRQLVLVNPETQRLRGESFQQGKSLEECSQGLIYRRPDGREWEMADLPMRRALNYGETVRAEEVIIEFPDGHTIPTLVNATPVYSLEGQIVSVIGIIQDMTPLQELEKMRNDFLGMVTHELRTPLSTIKGAAATGLRSRVPLRPNENQEFFKIIEEQVDHLTDLVNDLLDMTSIEAGIFAVTVEPTDLSSILEESIAGFHRIQNNHQVECQIPEDPPLVNADRRRIIQVLGNLLDNAARFSPPDSPITVVLDHDEGYVTIRVRDCGPGIPQDRLAYLFKKFTRIDENSSSDPGMGLGLAICQGIVEAHGGRIWATSDPEDTGTTISFTLVEAIDVEIPSLVNSSPGGMPMEVASPPGEYLKILAVDDDQNALRFLRRLLEGAGYLPILSGDPEEVLELVDLQKPDLILLDVVLPRVNGLDLMQRIREYSDVPIIFLTARDGRDDMVNALKAGGDDYITKPFSESELLARIEAVLRRKAINGNTGSTSPYEFDDLAIDFDQRRVTAGDREISLSATEYKLLCELAKHAGRVMTHDQILQLVWGHDYYGETELLRSTVRRLRNKLGDDAQNPRYIFTVAQVGYRMAGP